MDTPRPSPRTNWTRRVPQLDDADSSEGAGAYVGAAALPLAPLLAHRGFTARAELRDARGQPAAVLAVDVHWEPEALAAPRAAPPVADAADAAALLLALRRWVQHAGLGGVDVACRALFDAWLREPGAAPGAPGLGEAAFLGALAAAEEDFAPLPLSAAQRAAAWHAMATPGEGGQLLRRADFARAVAGARDPLRASGGTPAPAPAPAPADGALEVAVTAVAFAPRFTSERVAGVREVRLALGCLGRQPAGLPPAGSEPFDNSAAAGGFAPLRAAWGGSPAQRAALQAAVAPGAPEGLCVELLLTEAHAPGAAPAGAAARPPGAADALAAWRLPLRELPLRGDLLEAPAALVALADAPSGGYRRGELVGQATVTVRGAAWLAALARAPREEA